jgi:copper homeostasis protein (lipoprotein)
MRLPQLHIYLGIIAIAGIVSCKSKPDKKAENVQAAIKGIYSFEPGAKTFTACGNKTQFWVADSSAQLELQYSQIVNFEQQGQSVYVEVEGKKIKSVAGTDGAVYDSTLIVKKVIKITKDIPADCK